MKISIGQSNKLYTHKFRPTCNTSASFGDVQPILCRKLHGNDSINVNTSNFVRLMPMPYPSLADINLKTHARFVPMGDIAPWYDNYLSQTPFYQEYFTRSFVPKFQPCIMISELWSALFNDSYFAVSTKSDDTITLSSCDYIERKVSTSTDYVGYRLTQSGYIVNRVLTGLGYRLSVTDNTLVNIMPIFAYCRALWDAFGIKSGSSIEETNFYRAIQMLSMEISFFDGSSFYTSEYVDETGTILFSGSDIIHKLFLYIANYSYCTLPTDYYSAHQISPYGGLDVFAHGEDIPNNDIVGSNDRIIAQSATSKTGPTYSVPTLQYSQDTNVAPAITSVQLSLLSRLTQMFAKDSIIGNNIKKFVEKRFGSAISNQIYSETLNCGFVSSHINVSDIDSLADTAQTDFATGDNYGSYLGSYAGKGVGSGNGSFSCKSDSDGYFIILQWIEANEGMYNGIAPELQYFSQSDEARPEYDALGYELSPKSIIWTDNNIGDSSSSITNDSAFGFIPRYSGWKVQPNIVNGDLRLMRYGEDMKCFYLDRDPISNQVTFSDDGKTITNFNHMELPNASEVWRYLGKYPQLQNFNRIFYNSEYSTSSSYTVDGEVVIGNHVPDNFIIHNVLDITHRNHLKPMALSYDTFIDNVDNSSIEVHQS